MFMNLSKRGDVNWFVVSIILAVATLIVFLFVFAVFPWQQTVDRVACHESIIVKASLPETTIIDFKSMVNTRCKSRYVCVTAKTSGDGECSGLGKSFETMRLSGATKAEKEQQIKMFLAREMADCWNMFGEGNLQIFSREWKLFEATKSTGIICDKIQFDNSVLFGKDKKDDGLGDEIKTVSGFMYYMATHKVPNKNMSYMDYIRNTPQGDSAAQLYGSMVDLSVRGVEPFGAKTVQESDIVNLSDVKSIFYLETSVSVFGKVIGQATGFALAFFAVGRVTGKVMASFRVAATAAPAATAAASTMSYKYGLIGAVFGSGLFSQVGDDAYRWITGWTGEESYVGGLIFTNYDLEGFSKHKIGEFTNSK